MMMSGVHTLSALTVMYSWPSYSSAFHSISGSNQVFRNKCTFKAFNLFDYLMVPRYLLVPPPAADSKTKTFYSSLTLSIIGAQRADEIISEDMRLSIGLRNLESAKKINNFWLVWNDFLLEMEPPLTALSKSAKHLNEAFQPKRLWDSMGREEDALNWLNLLKNQNDEQILANDCICEALCIAGYFCYIKN